MVPASGWKNALTEATLTIAPPPVSSIAVTAARVARSALKKFSCIAHSNSSSLVPRKPSTRRRTAPTLFTSTSTRPCSCRARPTSCAGPSGAARSTGTAVTRSSPSRVSVPRAPATTRAPSPARVRVIASPMPLLAPVTTATLPSSPRSMVRSADLCRSGGRRRGGGRVELAVEPAVDRCRDLFPPLAHHGEVGASLELEVFRRRGRVLVLLVLRLRHGRRHRVVFLRADDEQRGALRVLEVHIRGGVQCEVRESGLVEDPAGLGDRVALVRSGRLLGAEGVHKTVGELLERQRDDSVPRRGMRERRGGRLQRRERQDEDALGRRRAERDAHTSDATVEEQLDDQAPEGVADQDGRLVELADQRLIVVHDLGQPETRELVDVVSEILHVADLAGPLGSGDREAALSEVVGEGLPAACR